MRIGTWNLQGRWDERHHDRLVALDCDVLLLTEVSERVSLPGYVMHRGAGVMAPKRRWAAIASRLELVPKPDPHGASAAAEVDGLEVCASILPWRSCGAREPWVGSTTFERTVEAVDAIERFGPSIWGGDWNHALEGSEYTGSKAGRGHLLGAVDRLGLQVPTASMPHQIDGLLSIDHIAIPQGWTVVDVRRHRAFVGDVRISDHDAYVAEVAAGKA